MRAPGWPVGTSRVPARHAVPGLTLMLMYASTHPWRSAAVSLCGAAGLALAVGLGAATETGAPALDLASDAVVMPSATPLPAEPASTELDVPAADGVRVPVPSASTDHSASPSLSSSPPAPVAPPAPSVSAAVPSVAPAEEAVPEAAEEPAAVESVAAPTPTDTSRPPIVGPAMPTGGDLDCADFERQSFPIDPANDPNNLDADGDGIACEPPPGARESEDLDCSDFTERSFRIDPANDPNNLDRDRDGIACEPPPGE
jgi:hypothetical protein